MAQTFRGSIGGTVKDASGAVVPGANLMLTEVNTNIERSTTSNSDGIYLFPDLPLGLYRVIIAKEGFKKVSSSEITVTTGQVVEFSATLEPGEVNQTIDVAAAAPTINTENAQIDNVLPQEALLNLPLNQRGAMSFRYIDSANYGGGWIGGQRGDFGNYTLDGVTGMAPAWGAWSGPTMQPSLEAVQEMKILSSNTSAEYTDLATVYVSTRSGSNQLHGSAFYVHNNWALNAKNYFAAEKPWGPINHQYGGSIGGPVFIPKLYDGRNKTFFFFAHEWIENPGKYDVNANVPTVKMRAGDFSDLLPDTQIIDPVTNQPFPNNIIPQERISEVSNVIQNYENFIPQPNFGPANNIFANYRELRSDNSGSGGQTIRIDHNLSSKDTLSGRINFTQEPRPGVYQGDLPAFRWNQWRNTKNGFLSETHVFSPTLVNEFRVGYTRDASQVTGYHKGCDVVNAWGLQGIDLSNSCQFSGVPYINFQQNFSGLGEDATYGWMQETYEYLDNLTWTKGKHNFKGGALFRRNRINNPDGGQGVFGSFNFDGYATGYDYADFLLGIPHSSQRYVRGNPRYNRSLEMGLYFQDDWKITPNLTLNLGLRYDYFTPPIDKYDMRYAFDPATGNLVVPNQKVLDTMISPVFPQSIPIVTAAEAGFPERSLLEPDRNNFAPRIGFAYQPFGNSKTVVRGGFGVYFTHLTYTMMDFFSGGPFHSNENFTNTLNNGVPLFQFPLPFTETGDVGTQSVDSLNTNTQMPYTTQYSLTIERELGNSTVFKIGYRGFQTHQLLYTGDFNKPFPSTDPANENLYTYPNFSTVNRYLNGGNQNGNALDIKMERKFAKGLSFQAGYTYMRDLSDVPGSSEAGYWWDPVNPYDRNSNKGNVDGVFRNRFVASYLYEIPFGTGKRYGASLHPVLRQILGNWQSSGILNFESGTFLTPYQCCVDSSNTRTWYSRADQIGNPNVSNPNNDGWFNPEAFAFPPENAGRYGNSAYGVFQGPGISNFDFGIFKYITIHERARMQVRMTATNFFNHPNFGNPETEIDSDNVGKIRSTRGGALGGGSRQIQVGLRIEF